MGAQKRSYAVAAGLAGALLWLFASVGSALGEIEYQDASRVSPIPDWMVGVGIAAGAVLIAAFVQYSGVIGGRDRMGAAKVTILVGAAISLVPLWPFFVLGPFLVAIGFFSSALAAWLNRRRTVGVALHAFALPLSIPSGGALEAMGFDGEYGVVVFMTVLVLGIAWRASEATDEGEAVASLPEEAPA